MVFSLIIYTVSSHIELPQDSDFPEQSLLHEAANLMYNVAVTWADISYTSIKMDNNVLLLLILAFDKNTYK